MIVTPERTCVLIISLFAVLNCSMAPVYVVNGLGQRFFPHKNKTMIGLILARNRQTVERISFLVNNAFIPFTAFLLIIICTIILTFQLHNKSKWRKKSTTTAQADSVSNRNQKVAKMVVTISTVFIVCFVPVSAMSMVIFIDPRFSIGGTFMNMLLLIGGLGFVLESINSSVNIFVYYQMSSKYRDVFHECFCLVNEKPATKTGQVYLQKIG